MKVIYLSNVFSEFEKIVELINKIQHKTGKFDLLILNGLVFNEEKGITGLGNLDNLDLKVIIHDFSNVGTLVKHLKEAPEIFEVKVNNISNQSNIDLQLVENTPNLNSQTQTVRKNEVSTIQDFDDYVLINNHVYFLKRSGVINIDDLSIAFLNGFEFPEFGLLENLMQDSMNEETKFNLSKKIFTYNYFNKHDVEKLFNLSNTLIDILLLHSNPKHIVEEMPDLNNITSPLNRKEKLNLNLNTMLNKSSKTINAVANVLNPRYILVSSGDDYYYERTPYINDLLNQIGVRVLHFASHSPSLKVNPKEKSMYALSIDPFISNTESENINTIDSSIKINPKIKVLEKAEIEKCTANPFRSYTKDLINLYIIPKTSTFNRNSVNIHNQQPIREVITTISKNEIYVGNLSNSVTKEDLSSFFSSQLKIIVDSVHFPNRENRCMGYAFIKINELTEKKRQEILSYSNKFSLYGKKIVLGEKTEKKIVGNNNEMNNASNLTCWFCFENPKIDMSLIITSSFEHFYLAFPKGAIDEYHFLVIPKKHIFSTNHYDSEQKKELSIILTGLFDFLRKRSLEYFLYEKYLPFNDDVFKHDIINVIGIKKEYSFGCYDYATEFCKKKNLTSKFSNITENQIIDSITPSDTYFFNAVFPNGLGGKNNLARLVVSIPSNQTQNSDIIRIMLCGLIEKEENVDWKRSNVKPKDFSLMKDELINLYKFKN